MWKIFSKLNYSNPANKKMFENQITGLKEQTKFVNDLLVQNIITSRNNLLVLSGGLMAFIGVVHPSLKQDTNIFLKLTIVCFLTTIFFAIIVATIGAVYDIKLIKYKSDVIKNYLISVGNFLQKVKKIEFDKEEVENYKKINEKYKNDMELSTGYKIGGFFLNISTGIYSISLIIGMISLIIFYVNLIF